MLDVRPGCLQHGGMRNEVAQVFEQWRGGSDGVASPVHLVLPIAGGPVDDLCFGVVDLEAEELREFLHSAEDSLQFGLGPGDESYVVNIDEEINVRELSLQGPMERLIDQGEKGRR